MNVLDLRSIRCPLALVTLKQTLLSTTSTSNGSLKLLFSTQAAMQDIILYLDKKAYRYELLEDEKELAIMIITNEKFKGNKC